MSVSRSDPNSYYRGRGCKSRSNIIILVVTVVAFVLSTGSWVATHATFIVKIVSNPSGDHLGIATAARLNFNAIIFINCECRGCLFEYNPVRYVNRTLPMLLSALRRWSRSLADAGPLPRSFFQKGARNSFGTACAYVTYVVTMYKVCGN